MVATKAFTASQIETVLPGMVLVRPVARQVKTLVMLSRLDGRTISPAGAYGAGWRDLATQRLFYLAYHGNAAAIRELRSFGTTIDPHLHVNVAAPGTSSHGDSTRIDVLFDGRNASDADVAWMHAHEFAHEFGAADRNHFAWTGDLSGRVARSWQVRVVAHLLNARGLGRSTSADRDGQWPARSNLSWLVQTAGHEAGLYPPPFKIDGMAGDRTRWVLTQLFERWMSS